MIRVNETAIDERDIDNLLQAARSGWISSTGSFLTAFERGWAAYCGMEYGVAVSSGTAALHVACAVVGLAPGDEVILPSFTIISCVTAILAAGAVPVLVDADPETWCMDTGQIEARITSRTRAIMPVHIYGHPVDMRPVMELAGRHGLTVIEDAAEAHGSEYYFPSGSRQGWRRCGGMGQLSAFSFYANKLITTGEGGMVLTDDPTLAKKAAAQRNLCFQPHQRFVHAELGSNYRLTNLQAALGVGQIERLSSIIEKKRWMATQYSRRLADLPELQLPVERPWARSVYWMYGIVLRDGAPFDAIELADRLKVCEVETRPFFVGMHQQPALLKRGLFQGEQYPVTEWLAQRGLYLPSGLTLTESQVDRVAAAVHSSLR